MEQESKVLEQNNQESKENELCQTMIVALWIKKKRQEYISEFIDFMGELGFEYYDYREPDSKSLKGKVLILFFTYNSCKVCEIEGIERPLSIDGAMLNYINSKFSNLIYDFHNINPRCNYEEMKKYKIVIDENKGDENNE